MPSSSATRKRGRNSNAHSLDTPNSVTATTTTTTPITKSATKRNSSSSRLASKLNVNAAANFEAGVSSPIAASAITRTLVIDNGGDTIKYGWTFANSESKNSKNKADSDTQTAVDNKEDSRTSKNIAYTPFSMPNITARLPQQWTVLAGDEAETVMNKTTASPSMARATITRSTERGIITNMGNQIQVWKRLLSNMNVQILLDTETAIALGWDKMKGTNKINSNHKQSKTSAAKSANSTPNAHDGKTETFLSANCAVMIALAPYTPRCVLDHVLRVWFDDFGFGYVGLCTSPWIAAYALLPSSPFHTPLYSSICKYDTLCVVDLGYSATHVLPIKLKVDKHVNDSGQDVFEQGKKVSVDLIEPRAIRRMPLGGRHLIQMWKYYASYRQYNLMDQDHIISQLLQQAAYVSLDYANDLKIAQQKVAGRRPFDLEYLLPDYHTRMTGQLQVPLGLQKEMKETNSSTRNLISSNNFNNSDDDGDSQGKKKIVPNNKKKDGLSSKGFTNNMDDGSNSSSSSIIDDEGVNTDSNADSDDDDDDDIEQRRRQILNQRALEEQRQQEEMAEQQVLKLSVERFTIAETLFRPIDAGLPADCANLPMTISKAIQACPELYQPALYGSIVLIGGLSQLCNLKARIEHELRSLAPIDVEVKIECIENATEQAWNGACVYTSMYTCKTWGVSAGEWAESSRRSVWGKMTYNGGGHLV